MGEAKVNYVGREVSLGQTSTAKHAITATKASCCKTKIEIEFEIVFLGVVLVDSRVDRFILVVMTPCAGSFIWGNQFVVEVSHCGARRV